MDYKTIMEKDAEYNYQEVYEKSINGILDDFKINESIKQKLKEKREFGFKKYGEHSFQGSLQATLTCPVEEHLLEELIDAINYIAHIKLQCFLLGKKMPLSYKEIAETANKVIPIIEERIKQ